MNYLNEIKSELKCINKIKRKWWAIIQNQKRYKLSEMDKTEEWYKFNGKEGVYIL